MDNNTYQNWLKVKEGLEKSGNTNNDYYKRSCVIVNTKKDPFSNIIDPFNNRHEF